MIGTVVRLARQAFRFLYDFLVGDAWELFIGPIAGIVVAAILLGAGLPASATGLLLFAIVASVAGIHLARVLRDAE